MKIQKYWVIYILIINRIFEKENNLNFSKFIGSIDSDGRLEMPNVQVSHGGTYICQATDYPNQSGSSVSVYLKVVSSKSTEISS